MDFAEILTIKEITGLPQDELEGKFVRVTGR